MAINSISFFIPAYNCAKTIKESVDSILDDNFEPGAELIIVNDGSTDDTAHLLNCIKKAHPFITILNHSSNKGGAAARNSAAEYAHNQILFCLDSDNLLVPGSIKKLKKFLIDTNANVASFQELHYFQDSKERITHKWIFKQGETTLADYLSGHVVPGASGNYMFTKESWSRVGGYPEFAGALDAWGFGFRQVASGSKMIVMPNSFYYHRHGHESYWVRDSKKGKISLTALQIIIPFIDLLYESDVDYIMSRKGRYTWFENLDKRPLRLKSGKKGKTGTVISDDIRFKSKSKHSLRNLIKKTFGMDIVT